jgi:hypothetical protein
MVERDRPQKTDNTALALCMLDNIRYCACLITYATDSGNMLCLFLSFCDSGFAKAPQCYAYTYIRPTCLVSTDWRSVHSINSSA